MSKVNQRNVISILATLLVIAIAAIVFQFINGMNLKQQLEGRIQEMADVQLNLETEYEEAIASLDALHGENADLNQMIEVQKKELSTQKKRIASLIRQNKDLDAVRSEIENLKSQAQQYLAQIETLQAENDLLHASNSQLSIQRDSLNASLESEVSAKTALIEEKANLETSNEKLSGINKQLGEKVTKASVLSISEIEAESLMHAANGKLKRKRVADKVDQINVCFNVNPNVITEEGNEVFLLRIVQPSGETMSMENKGSGIFVNKENGQEMRYTISGSFNYNHSDKSVCMEWFPEIPFQEGDYAIELYNKGYLSGKTSLNLK